jgi:hypothetical protein
VAYFFAWVAGNLTDHFAVIAMCSIGFTIACIETYKTFFFPSRPRGKFQGKPVLFPDMLERRKPFAWLYAGIWIFVITMAVLAFAGENEGLV